MTFPTDPAWEDSDQPLHEAWSLTMVLPWVGQGQGIEGKVDDISL